METTRVRNGEDLQEIATHLYSVERGLEQGKRDRGGV